LALNIRCGGWGNSASGFDDAIRHAEFSSVLEKLPAGIETRVTDAGSSLSDGQRQRISIARALFKNAKIIIVDEATSSLDLALETRVIENIRKHHPDAILLFITHRVTSLSHCDYVYFIDAGTIVSERSPKNDALLV
jgi:ABC-type bacteriocin/lantibiotic exporter with double-glycine peptidase domain